MSEQTLGPAFWLSIWIQFLRSEPRNALNFPQIGAVPSPHCSFEELISSSEGKFHTGKG